MALINAPPVPKRTKPPVRKKDVEDESFLAKWKKPLLAAAAAAVLLTFFSPLKVLGKWWGKPRTYPAHGQVFLEEDPVPQAAIVLEPTWTKELTFPRPHGVVNEDGSFVLGTYAKDDGAPPGEYKVAVTLYETKKNDSGPNGLPRNLLPPKYGRFETSGLTVKVVKGENEFKPFKLTR